jgi:hypothetical protein
MWVPFVNLVMIFVLGARGNAWAWKNARWRDVEHFKRVQKAWAIWGLVSWIAVIGLAGFGFFSILSLLKTSEPYQVALQEVRGNPEVQAVIGDTITDGFMPTGSINYSGDSGKANLSFQITGSRGKGTVDVSAIRSGGAWDIRLIVVRPDGGGEPIVIVNKDNLRVGGSVGA